MINTFTIAGVVHSIEKGCDERGVSYCNLFIQVNEYNPKHGTVECEEPVPVVLRGKTADIAKQFRMYDVVTVQGKIRCKNNRVTLIGLFANNVFSNTGERLSMDIMR